ncbi:hypothetical protein FRC17_003568 [Serendipita sp. 399]|nr:hypothetical protein FRC17_003568 [Serendipita sp. 399]
MRSQQEIKGIWKGMVQKEQEIEGNVAKMKGRLLSIYQHQHQPLQDHHDIDGDDNDTVAKDKNHEEEKGSTVEFKAALGTKWSEIKHRFEEMRRARGEKRGDMTHLERHLMNKDDVDEEPVRI